MVTEIVDYFNHSLSPGMCWWYAAESDAQSGSTLHSTPSPSYQLYGLRGPVNLFLYLSFPTYLIDMITVAFFIELM